MTTKNKAAIAQSLTVIKTLAPNDETPEPSTQIAVLHLGHPSDSKYGTIEMMTPAQYEKFRWLNTWPRQRAARTAIEASERERMRYRQLTPTGTLVATETPTATPAPTMVNTATTTQIASQGPTAKFEDTTNEPGRMAGMPGVRG